MTALFRLFSWPLLTKELTETAARRRTYVLRVVYGVLLFAVFAAMAPHRLWRGNYDLLSIMGIGSEMFEIILGLQFAGIGLFLPAMMCGRITEEKERDSLALLFLTDLGPWSIVLQKYLGGLVPMLSFLLLAAPLTAIAYAFGGVETEALAVGLYALLLACLQVGALALLCSAWCRTTVSALVSTYLLGAAFYIGPVLLREFVRYSTGSRWGISEDEASLHIPPALLWSGGGGSPGATLLRSIPILVSIAVFLLLARVFLVRRAFVPASSFFLRLFRRLDGVMHRANRLTGHVMLVRDARSLPDDDPIAWREMTRKALGKVHYLVRILVAIELPVIVLCALAVLEDSGYRGQSEWLSILATSIGTLAILALTVQAANTVVSERVQQTLEVLLTTPLTAREIVAQKARVLRRFRLVLAIPLLTIFGSEFYMEWDWVPRHGRKDSPAVYLVGVLLTVGLLLPFLSWLSLWIGLKMRTRFKAILTALAVVVAWCVVPAIGAGFLLDYDFSEREIDRVIAGALLILSPLAVPFLNEQSALHEFPPFFGRDHPPFDAWWSQDPPDPANVAWFALVVYFIIYGALLLLFRHLALTRADRYLRR